MEAAGRAALAKSWTYSHALEGVLARHPHILLPEDLRQLRARLQQASSYEDLNLATDYLATASAPPVPLAVRVRSFHYLRPYGHEIVLRAQHRAGGLTEADKVLTLPAAASVYLYAFADPSDSGFAQWVAVDLVRLRRLWADTGAIPTLAPRRVLFPDGAGVAFTVERLMSSHCVLAAELARPSFTSTRDVLAALTPQRWLWQLAPEARSALARWILRNGYQVTAVNTGGPS